MQGCAVSSPPPSVLRVNARPDAVTYKVMYTPFDRSRPVAPTLCHGIVDNTSVLSFVALGSGTGPHASAGLAQLLIAPACALSHQIVMMGDKSVGKSRCASGGNDGAVWGTGQANTGFIFLRRAALCVCPLPCHALQSCTSPNRRHVCRWHGSADDRCGFVSSPTGWVVVCFKARVYQVLTPR